MTSQPPTKERDMDERMTTEELVEHLVNVADYEMASAVAIGYAGTILEGVRRRTDKYRAAARRLTLLAKVAKWAQAAKEIERGHPEAKWTLAEMVDLDTAVDREWEALDALAADLPTPTTEER